MTDPGLFSSASTIDRARWLSLFLLVTLVLLADHGWSYPAVSGNISVPVHPRSMNVHTEAHETSALSKAPPAVESPLLSRLNTGTAQLPLPVVAPSNAGGPRIDGTPVLRVFGFETNKSQVSTKGKEPEWRFERQPITDQPGTLAAFLGGSARSTIPGGYKHPSVKVVEASDVEPITTDQYGIAHMSKRKMQNSGIGAMTADYEKSKEICQKLATLEEESCEQGDTDHEAVPKEAVMEVSNSEHVAIPTLPVRYDAEGTLPERSMFDFAQTRTFRDASASQRAEASGSRLSQMSSPRSPANTHGSSRSARSKPPAFWAARPAKSGIVAPALVVTNDVNSRASFDTGSIRASQPLHAFQRRNPIRRPSPQPKEEGGGEMVVDSLLEAGRSSPIDIRGPSRRDSISAEGQSELMKVVPPTAKAEKRATRDTFTLYSLPTVREKKTAPVTFVFRVLGNAFLYLPDSLFPAAGEVVDVTRVMRELYVCLIREAARAKLYLLFSPMMTFKEEVMANPNYYFTSGEFALFFEQYVYHFVTRAPPAMQVGQTVPLLRRTSSFSETKREEALPRVVRDKQGRIHRFAKDVSSPSSAAFIAGLNEGMVRHLVDAPITPSQLSADTNMVLALSDTIMARHRKQRGRPHRGTARVLKLADALSEEERYKHIFAFAQEKRNLAPVWLKTQSKRAFHYQGVVVPLRPLLPHDEERTFVDPALVRRVDQRVLDLYHALPDRPPTLSEPKEEELSQSLPALHFTSPTPRLPLTRQSRRFDPSQDVLRALTVEPKPGVSKSPARLTYEEAQRWRRHAMAIHSTPPLHWTDFMHGSTWFNKTAEEKHPNFVSSLVLPKMKERKRRWSSGRVVLDRERDFTSFFSLLV